MSPAEWLYTPGLREARPGGDSSDWIGRPYDPEPALAGCVVVVASRIGEPRERIDGNGIIVHSAADRSTVLCPAHIVWWEGGAAEEIRVGIMEASWKSGGGEPYSEYRAEVLLVDRRRWYDMALLSIPVGGLVTVWEAQVVASLRSRKAMNMRLSIVPYGVPTILETLPGGCTGCPAGCALFSEGCFCAMAKGDDFPWFPALVPRESIARFLRDAGIELPGDAMRCSPMILILDGHPRRAGGVPGALRGPRSGEN